MALQVCILYAVTHGYLDDVAVEDIRAYEEGLYEEMTGRHSAILQTIRETGDLSKETEAQLAAALDAYGKGFAKTA